LSKDLLATAVRVAFGAALMPRANFSAMDPVARIPQDTEVTEVVSFIVINRNSGTGPCVIVAGEFLSAET
jgi:hypothetical protein